MIGSDRFHALDAVRGAALVMGVFFHAALSFLPGPQIWVVADASRSAELSVLFFVLHIFRMTVFFLLAGFFARLLLEKRGWAAFIANRAKRIALPLVVFWPIALTGIVAVMIWAAVQANGGVMPEGEPPAPLTAETFPLTHLWFLYVLLVFYVVALALRACVALIDRRGVLRARLLDPLVRFVSFFAPVLLGVPVALVLYFTPDWYGWFGIPTPDTGIVPKATSLIIYGIAFGFGWLIQRQPDILSAWASNWGANLGAAIGASAMCVMMAGTIPVLTPARQDMYTLAYALLYGVAGWAWTLAIVGFAVRFLSGESRTRRYLADASYWIYLVHLPIVMALQTLLAPYAWPWFVKYPLLLACAFAVMLASYQLFVRYSFIGAILNGKRERPARQRSANAQLAAAE